MIGGALVRGAAGCTGFDAAAVAEEDAGASIPDAPLEADAQQPSDGASMKETEASVDAGPLTAQISGALATTMWGLLPAGGGWTAGPGIGHPELGTHYPSWVSDDGCEVLLGGGNISSINDIYYARRTPQ